MDFIVSPTDFDESNCLAVPSSNPIKIAMALEELELDYKYIVLNVFPSYIHQLI